MSMGLDACLAINVLCHEESPSVEMWSVFSFRRRASLMVTLYWCRTTCQLWGDSSLLLRGRNNLYPSSCPLSSNVGRSFSFPCEMVNPLPLLRRALHPFVLFVNYVRRLSRSTVAIIGAMVLGLGAMALLFFKANPLGENDASFSGSLDADQTGVNFYLGNEKLSWLT